MMATRDSQPTNQTQTITEEPQQQDNEAQEQRQPQQPQQLVLHLRPLTQSSTSSKPPEERRVTFTPDTIDNEHLGRLKSNCCCIYVPPRKWDDPSTWTPDESETEHCRGHTLPPPPPPSQKKPGDNDNNKDDEKRDHESGGTSGHGPGCC